MNAGTITTGQTFRQHGARQLHIFGGPITRTDRGGNVTTYDAAVCGAAYQPGMGDKPESSGKKVCAKCQAQYVPATEPTLTTEQQAVRVAIESGTRAQYRKALKALDAVTEREADWRTIGQALNTEKVADRKGTPAQIATPWIRELVGLARF